MSRPALLPALCSQLRDLDPWAYPLQQKDGETEAQGRQRHPKSFGELVRVLAKVSGPLLSHLCQEMGNKGVHSGVKSSIVSVKPVGESSGMKLTQLQGMLSLPKVERCF